MWKILKYALHLRAETVQSIPRQPNKKDKNVSRKRKFIRFKMKNSWDLVYNVQEISQQFCEEIF